MRFINAAFVLRRAENKKRRGATFDKKSLPVVDARSVM